MDREVLKTNLNALFEYARAVEAQTGRRLYIVGATKTRTAEEINLAASLGLEIAGENKAQEFRDKMPLVSSSVQKHFIGHLQTNKVAKVIQNFDYIHSVDSLHLAEKISQEAVKMGKLQKIFLEVNFANEEQKFGFSKSNLKSEFAQIIKLPNLTIQGLMSMSPLGADERFLTELFTTVKETQSELTAQYGLQMPETSMGMSQDYNVAVRCGATMLRIGRKLFT